MNGFGFAGMALGYIAAGAGIGFFLGGGLGAALGAIVGFGFMIVQIARAAKNAGDDDGDDASS